jgi:hypothetical protein
MKLVERQKREREGGREPIKSQEEGEEVRELSCEANSDLFVNKNKIINFWSIFVMGGV